MLSEAKEGFERNKDKIFNVADQMFSEYERLGVLVKKVFGLDPYVPEENRVINFLYRVGAPELAEAYRDCIRAAEV